MTGWRGDCMLSLAAGWLEHLSAHFPPTPRTLQKPQSSPGKIRFPPD